MKTNLLNKTYTMTDTCLIQVDSKTKNKRKSITQDIWDGDYKLMAVYNGRRLESILFHMPEYASQMFSFNPVLDSTDLNQVSFLTNNKEIGHPLNIKTKYLELFENGFTVKNNCVVIHTAQYFNKSVGYLIDFSNA